MELRLYDTMTKEKRPFAPLDPKNVRMYVCGPTVYDYAHIGNARPVIVFDVLFRLLRHIYGERHVTYVRNITDVDDKINDRAARDYPELPLNEAIRKVTEQTGAQFHADVDALGCLRPTIEPRATEHIAEMRTIIDRLIANGNAYVEQDHVLFAVGTMPAYGRLSRRSLDELLAGARVDVAAYKRNDMDFVLWKPSKPGEPSWASPGGIAVEGRPGWHIECSAMAWKHLGEQFDIHGGGIDLVFPHHENEIAQSCCAFHSERMAQVWMHNGFLQVEGAKMSKSLGNFVTINELLETNNFGGDRWDGDVLRLAMLKTHYRSPIDWTVKGLDEAHKIIWDWNADVAGVEPDEMPPNEFIDALADDLNMPAAMAIMHRLRRDKKFGALRSAMNLIGLSGKQTSRRPAGARAMPGVLTSKAEVLAPKVLAVSETQIDQLIKDRTSARAHKDFKESDRIRDELAAMGVVLKDGKDAAGNPVTTWEMAR